MWGTEINLLLPSTPIYVTILTNVMPRLILIFPFTKTHHSSFILLTTEKAQTCDHDNGQYWTPFFYLMQCCIFPLIFCTKVAASISAMPPSHFIYPTECTSRSQCSHKNEQMSLYRDQMKTKLYNISKSSIRAPVVEVICVEKRNDKAQSTRR